MENLYKALLNSNAIQSSSQLYANFGGGAANGAVQSPFYLPQMNHQSMAAIANLLAAAAANQQQNNLIMTNSGAAGIKGSAPGAAATGQGGAQNYLLTSPPPSQNLQQTVIGQHHHVTGHQQHKPPQAHHQQPRRHSIIPTLPTVPAKPAAPIDHQLNLNLPNLTNLGAAGPSNSIQGQPQSTVLSPEEIEQRIARLISENEAILEPSPVLTKRRSYTRQQLQHSQSQHHLQPLQHHQQQQAGQASQAHSQNLSNNDSPPFASPQAVPVTSSGRSHHPHHHHPMINGREYRSNSLYDSFSPNLHNSLINNQQQQINSQQVNNKQQQQQQQITINNNSNYPNREALNFLAQVENATLESAPKLFVCKFCHLSVRHSDDLRRHEEKCALRKDDPCSSSATPLGAAQQLGAGGAQQLGAGIAQQLGAGIAAQQLGAGIAQQLGAGISQQLGAGISQQLGAGSGAQIDPVANVVAAVAAAASAIPQQSGCKIPLKKRILAAAELDAATTAAQQQVTQLSQQPIKNAAGASTNQNSATSAIAPPPPPAAPHLTPHSASNSHVIKKLLPHPQSLFVASLPYIQQLIAAQQLQQTTPTTVTFQPYCLTTNVGGSAVGDSVPVGRKPPMTTFTDCTMSRSRLPCSFPYADTKYSQYGQWLQIPVCPNEAKRNLVMMGACQLKARYAFLRYSAAKSPNDSQMRLTHSSYWKLRQLLLANAANAAVSATNAASCATNTTSSAPNASHPSSSSIYTASGANNSYSHSDPHKRRSVSISPSAKRRHEDQEAGGHVTNANSHVIIANSYADSRATNNNNTVAGIAADSIMDYYADSPSTSGAKPPTSITPVSSREEFKVALKTSECLPNLCTSQTTASTSQDAHDPTTPDPQSGSGSDPQSGSGSYVWGRGRGRFQCDRCGIRCEKPSMLKKHLKSHLNLRPYNCSGCSFSFKTKGNLTKHLKTMAHHVKVNGGGSHDSENGSRDENFDTAKNSANEDESDETLSDEGLEIVTDDENFDDNPVDAQKWQLSCDSSQDLNQEQSMGCQNLWQRIKNGIYFGRQCRTPYQTPPTKWSLDENAAGHVTRCPSAPSTTTINTGKYANFSTPSQTEVREFGKKEPTISQKSESDTSNLDCVLIIASPSPQNDQSGDDPSVHVITSDSHVISSDIHVITSNDHVPDSNDHVTQSCRNSDQSEPVKATVSTNSVSSSSHVTNSKPVVMTSSTKKQCEICGKEFAKPGLYELHCAAHTFEKSSSRRYDYKCSYCNSSCRSKNLLRKHLQTAHPHQASQEQSRDQGASALLSPSQPLNDANAPQINANLTISIGSLHQNSANSRILTSPDGNSPVELLGAAPNCNDPRPFKCHYCKVPFRIHGHLAKHLRSKSHIMHLENSGELESGTFSMLEESKCDKYAQIDTSDCLNSLESLRRIRAEMIAEKHHLSHPGAPISVAPVAQISPKNGLILSPRRDHGQKTSASTTSAPTATSAQSSLLCSEQFCANSPPILISNNDQQPIRKQLDYHSSNAKTVVADLWIPPKETPPNLHIVVPALNNLPNSTQNNHYLNSNNATLAPEMAQNDHQNQKDVCKFCDVAFSSSIELEIHWHSDHVLMRDGAYFKCPKPNCDTVYPTRQNLRNHLASHYYNTNSNNSGMNGVALIDPGGDFGNVSNQSRDVSRATVVALSRKIIGSSGLGETAVVDHGSSTNGGFALRKFHRQFGPGGGQNGDHQTLGGASVVDNSSPPQPSDSEASRQSTASSSRSLSPTPPSRPASKRNSSSVDTDIATTPLMTSSRGLGGVKRRLVASDHATSGPAGAAASDAPSTPTPPVLAAPVPLMPQRPLAAPAASAPIIGAPPSAALNHQLAAAVWNLLNNAALASAVGATPPLSPQSAAAAAAFVNQQQQITLQQQQQAAAALAAAKFASAAWPQQTVFAPPSFFAPANGIVGGGASLPTVASSLAPAPSLAPPLSVHQIPAAQGGGASANLPASIFSLENLRCIKCQKQFYSPMAVQEHIVTAHSEAVRLHVCPFCDAGFTTPRALAAHLPCKQQHQTQQQMR